MDHDHQGIYMVLPEGNHEEALSESFSSWGTKSHPLKGHHPSGPSLASGKTLWMGRSNTFWDQMYEKQHKKHPEKMGCWFGVWIIEASNKENLGTSSDLLQVTCFFPCWIEFRLTNGIGNFSTKKETPTKNQPVAMVNFILFTFCWFSVFFLWRVPDFFDISWIHLLKIPKQTTE